MTKDQAINLVEQVVVMFKGTREEHALLQQAMEVLKTLKEPTEKKS